eukprot:s1922_g2.t1
MLQAHGFLMLRLNSSPHVARPTAGSSKTSRLSHTPVEGCAGEPPTHVMHDHGYRCDAWDLCGGSNFLCAFAEAADGAREHRRVPLGSGVDSGAPAS